jgi:hypothetical protein
MEASYPEEESSDISYSTAMTKWWQAGLCHGKEMLQNSGWSV